MRAVLRTRAGATGKPDSQKRRKKKKNLYTEKRTGIRVLHVRCANLNQSYNFLLLMRLDGDLWNSQKEKEAFE